MKHLLITTSILLFLACGASAQKIIAAKKAARYYGRKVTICDMVYETRPISGATSTLLFLGADYPNQLLTVLINAADKTKPKGRPNIDFKGKDICVTGIIVKDKGKPQIVVNNASQIKVVLIDNPVKGRDSLK